MAFPESTHTDVGMRAESWPGLCAGVGHSHEEKVTASEAICPLREVAPQPSLP